MLETTTSIYHLRNKENNNQVYYEYYQSKYTDRSCLCKWVFFLCLFEIMKKLCRFFFQIDLSLQCCHPLSYKLQKVSETSRFIGWFRMNLSKIRTFIHETSQLNSHRYTCIAAEQINILSLFYI